MSVFVESPSPVEGLEALKLRAGAVLAPRQPVGVGAPASLGSSGVAISYGSAAGELSALVVRAGIADRSDLIKLELRGRPAELGAVVSDLAGGAVQPGGARWTGSVWWCATGSDRVLALAEAPTGHRLQERLRALATRRPAVHVADRSHEWAAIAVLGRHCGLILDALGVYGEAGDPRLTAPVTVGAIAAAPVTWLLESDRRALAILDRRLASAAWRMLERLGRPLGLARVGRDAVARYALLDRRGSL